MVVVSKCIDTTYCYYDMLHVGYRSNSVLSCTVLPQGDGFLCMLKECYGACYHNLNQIKFMFYDQLSSVLMYKQQCCMYVHALVEMAEAAVCQSMNLIAFFGHSTSFKMLVMIIFFT